MTERKGGNDLFERYLAETRDLRDEPALIRGDDGKWKTLDGTPHIPLSDLAQRTGRRLEDLTDDFNAGVIEGLRIGDQIYVRQEDQELETEEH